MSGWQPIETAPKDVTPLLLGVVYQAGWIEEVHVGFYSFGINDDEYDCWWSTQADDEIMPSFWMPMPSLPSPLTGEAR